MFEIDNDSFGGFVTKLRKEKGMTQKELAGQLFISDKAVSKWERGLSTPDIALLLPLANILGVTTTELLSGCYLDRSKELDIQQVEKLMTKTIRHCEKNREEQGEQRGARGLLFFACMAIVGLETMLMTNMGYPLEVLMDNLLTIELLMILFGGWFTFLAKEKLPTYYDENKITAYSDGVVRMNIPGVEFNNSNWPHIVRAGRISTLATLVAYPLVYFLTSWWVPMLWEIGRLVFTMAAAFAFFIPIYVVGRRYG